MKIEIVKSIEKQVNFLRKEEGQLLCQTFIDYVNNPIHARFVSKKFKGFAKKRIIDAPEYAEVTVYCTTGGYMRRGNSWLITCIDGEYITKSC